MKTKSRWTAEVNASSLLKGFNGLKCRGKFTDTPVLDLVCDDKLVTQVGLNVAHKHAEHAYFKNLVGNFQSIGNENLDSRFRDFCQAVLFGSTLWIMANDPSVSSFTFPRLHRFRIHTSDEYLMKQLDAEAEIYNERRLYVLLDRADGKASPEIAQMIAGTSDNYFLALGFLGEPQKQKRFNDSLVKLVRQQEERNRVVREARADLRQIRELAKKMSAGGVNSSSLSREVSKIEEEYRFRGTLSSQDVERLFQARARDGVKSMGRDLREPTIQCFSGVAKMPTTLHDRTNPGYSGDIVSYLVSEPFYDFVWFGEKVIPGFSKRRAMLNGNGKK